MSHINSVLYNFKIDMFSLNRAAIISVNKYNTSIDKFSYNKKVYETEFLKGLKTNYELDDNFQNDEKLITKIDVIEYEIYEENKKDLYTGKRCNERTIHTVLEVKIRPIILKEILEDIFIFKVHEDVALNSMKT